jgi:putative transposase
MSDTSQRLSHARWHGPYHVVFIPKRRRKALCDHRRKAFGPLLHAVARPKACRLLEGPVLPDHVPICIEMPPTHAVASVSGFLKGQSARPIARQLSGRERNVTGEPCWARG